MQNLKLIDKYLTKQLLETFLVGIVIFTSIMFASDTFITLVKQISTYGIPFKVAILIIILKLPTILVMTIPMGVLLSVVMTVNKLSLNSEVTVMRACGISVARLARPIIVFSIIAALTSFVLNEFVAPRANAQATTLTLWALSQKNIPDGKKNFSFKEVHSGNKLKRLFYVAHCENKTLNGVTVLDMSNKNTVQIIQSKYGKTTPENWIFNKGVIYTISGSGKILNTTVFDDLSLNNSIGSIKKFNKYKAREMNFFALMKYLNDKKNSLEKNFIKFSIELHDKIALPITTIILAIIGFPLAITPPRVKVNRGFLFSILIIFCYYLIKAFSISLGEAQILSPFLAAWMPNLILGTAGIMMFYNKAYKI